MMAQGPAKPIDSIPITLRSVKPVKWVEWSKGDYVGKVDFPDTTKTVVYSIYSGNTKLKTFHFGTLDTKVDNSGCLYLQNPAGLERYEYNLVIQAVVNESAKYRAKLYLHINHDNPNSGQLFICEGEFKKVK